MSNPPGHYHAQGDPPDTVRYWDGEQWVGDPVPAPSTAPPPPPGAAPGPATAGVGPRIGAGLIDLFIAVVISIVLTLILFGTSTGDNSFEANANAGESILVGVVIYAAFFGLMAATSSTPGKLMLGMRVTQADGETSLAAKDIFMRSLPYLAAMVIPLAGLLIWVLVTIVSIVFVSNDAQSRSVYDRIAKTLVVKT